MLVLLHALRRRTLGRLLLAAVIAVIASGVALHHSGLAASDHDAHHSGMDHGTAVSMCVGMAVAAIAVEGLLLIRRSRRNSRRSRRLPDRRLLAPAFLLPVAAAPPARAGPPLHLQLCVIRR